MLMCLLFEFLCCCTIKRFTQLVFETKGELLNVAQQNGIYLFHLFPSVSSHMTSFGKRRRNLAASFGGSAGFWRSSCKRRRIRFSGDMWWSKWFSRFNFSRSSSKYLFAAMNRPAAITSNLSTCTRPCNQPKILRPMAAKYVCNQKHSFRLGLAWHHLTIQIDTKNKIINNNQIWYKF